MYMNNGIKWAERLPAVFPRSPDIFQFVISHIGHREYEQVSVRVHTFP